jgi:ascorbate-specific PTS system EIIC-type component UlaA
LNYIYVFLIVFFIIIIFGTIKAGSSADSDYDSSTKSNFSRLTIIYIILGLMVFAAALFIIFKLS